MKAMPQCPEAGRHHFNLTGELFVHVGRTRKESTRLQLAGHALKKVADSAPG